MTERKYPRVMSRNALLVGPSLGSPMMRSLACSDLFWLGGVPHGKCSQGRMFASIGERIRRNMARRPPQPLARRHPFKEYAPRRMPSRALSYLSFVSALLASKAGSRRLTPAKSSYSHERPLPAAAPASNKLGPGSLKLVCLHLTPGPGPGPPRDVCSRWLDRGELLCC